MTGMAFHFFARAGIALELYDVIRKDCIGQQYATIKNWNFWLQKFLLSLTNYLVVPPQDEGTHFFGWDK